jgi:hypothetical protein
MPCPANILGYLLTISLVLTGAPRVECGSLLPLFAVRACPDVLPAFS